MAAHAAERRATQQHQSAMAATNGGGLRTAEDVERSIENLRQKMEAELEDRKLGLLEEKEERLSQLREEISQQVEDEEHRLQMEREASLKKLRLKVREETEEEEKMLASGKSDALRELSEKVKAETEQEEARLRGEMKTHLQEVREEVAALQNEEQTRLNEKKQTILTNIQSQVEEVERAERERLKEENERHLEAEREKLESELQEQMEEMEKKHAYRREQRRQELAEEHELDLERMVRELKQLQAEEREKKEVELNATRERQKAVIDLERGLEEVTKERKDELRTKQQRELEKMREEHGRKIRDLQDEFKDKEQSERRRLESQLETALRKLKADQEEQLSDQRNLLEEKKQRLQEEYRVKEDRMAQLEMEVRHRTDELQNTRSDLQKQENEHKERRRKFNDDRDNLEHEMDAEFASKAEGLNNVELERLKEERNRLKNEIREERQLLEKLRSERKALESDMKKLKHQQDQDQRKSSDLHERLEKARRDLDCMRAGKKQDTHSDDRTLTEDTGQSPANRDIQLEDLQSQVKVAKSSSMNDLSGSGESETEGTGRRRRRKSEGEKVLRRLRHRVKRNLWTDVSLSDESLSEEVLRIKHRLGSRNGIQEHLTMETDSIGLAKDFLRKQKQSLRQRQALLQAARQEWSHDMLRQQLGSVDGESASLLEDVRQSLEQEAIDIDKMKVNMSAGSRLLKEKEHKLRELQHLITDASGDEDTDTDFKVFDNHKPRQALNLASLALSDSDESSGISSIDFNLDDVTTPSSNLKKIRTTHSNTPIPDVAAVARMEQSLQKINEELGRALSMLGSAPSVPPYAPSNQPLPMQNTAPISTLSSMPSHQQMPETISSMPYGIGQTTNQYISQPQHTAGFSAYETAERALERKWKKYFGERRAPISIGMFGGSVAYSPITAREQFRSSRPSYPEVSGSNGLISMTTEKLLAEHKEWLRKFQRDVGLVSSHTKPSIVQETTPGLDLAALKSSTRTTPKTRPAGPIRLELDANNDIWVKQYV